MPGPLAPPTDVKHPFVVVIGGSAGAIDGIAELLSRLPRNLPAIVLCTVHRNVFAATNLRSVLARRSNIPVVIPEDGEALLAGVGYIGHPDRHLAVGPGLRARFIVDGFYRAHNIDALFASAARQAGSQVIGVVLSGLSADGTEGLTAIKEQGGAALVQSPEQAGYQTMPAHAIARDGKIDFVGPVDQLANEICRRVWRVRDHIADSFPVKQDALQSTGE
jgi:two-component system chemotaxis response regulator CheB